MRDSGSGALKRGSSTAAGILPTLAALTLLPTAFIALARAYWIFELFSHFRVQLIVLQLALLLGCLAARQLRWALIVALAGAFNALPVADYLLPDGVPGTAPGVATEGDSRGGPAGGTGNGIGATPASQRIRVVSANVLATNTDAAGLIELLRSVDPDVFAILELTDTFAASLSPFAAAYPHRVMLPEPGTFGLAVYSRWPIAVSDVLDLAGYAAIDARISGPGEAWHFLAVHLLPPMSAELAALRNAQLTGLADHLRQVAAPHIVAGDFNLSPYSPWFGDFLARTRLHSTLRGRGPARTWPSFFAPLGIPIDHVLVTDDFTVTQYAHGGDIGSDHYPVIVDMILR